MPKKIPDYKYLVFSGGGAAGVAFAGAFEQLCQEPEFSLTQIKDVAGTSMGSIAALLVCLGYTPAELLQKLLQIDMKKLSDSGSVPERLIRMYRDYGFYKGEALYQLICDLIKEKTGRDDPEKVTFADIKAIGHKDLHVVATKLYTLNGKPTGKRKIFSSEKTPDTPVAATILASCSAPPYFQRVRLKKVAKGRYILSEDGDVYNDGGVIDNLAMDIFDKAKYIPDAEHYEPETSMQNPYTLGLMMRASEKIVDPWHIPQKGIIADSSPIVFGTAVYHALLNRDDPDGMEKSKDRHRIVQIDRLGVTLAQFDISDEMKQALVQSGKLGVMRFFEVIRNAEVYDMKRIKHDFAERKVPIGKMWDSNRRNNEKEKISYDVKYVV